MHRTDAEAGGPPPFLKKGKLLTPDFGTVRNLINMASNGELIYTKEFHIVDMNIFEVWAIAIRSHLEGRSCV